MQPFRLPPKLPPHAMKTYAIVAPKETHFRLATCKEVDCPNYQRGWATTVDVNTPLGVQQANYIRLRSGRSFTFTENGTLVTFVFPPGQKCFQEHQIRIDRPELFIVREGDHRGNPRGTEARLHKNPADWVDDFASHQDRLATELEKG